MTWSQLLFYIKVSNDAPVVNFPVRIVPLLLRQDVQEFLARRERCFTQMEYSPLLEDTWKVQAMQEIPATIARDGREVSSTFLAHRCNADVTALIARADRDTYNHGARLLELAAYPIGIRPFLPVREVLTCAARFLEKQDLSIQVMQYRASIQSKRRTTMSHGPMTLAELDENLRVNGAQLEGVRIRAFDPIQDEICRVRLDDRCRLLVERWDLRDSPLDLTERLVENFKEGLDKITIINEEESARSRVLVVRTSLRAGKHFVRRLQERFSMIRGVLVFPLDPGNSESFKLIDFLSGVDCLIEPYDEDSISVIFGPETDETFVTRMKSLISQELYAEGVA